MEIRDCCTSKVSDNSNLTVFFFVSKEGLNATYFGRTLNV